VKHLRGFLAAICTLSLAGCIDSSKPIVTDAQPVFGPRLKLQLFTLRDGFAHDPERVTYAWNGTHYARTGGGMRDVRAFSLVPFEAGDFIIQAVPANRARGTEYALLRKIADAVFQVIAIDEADADEPTRAALCKHTNGAACRIETRDQLFAFARATAARKKDSGGLAIRLEDNAERPARRKPSHQH
jgi:hypothetical protein